MNMRNSAGLSLVMMAAALAACDPNGPPLIDLKVPVRPKAAPVEILVDANAPGERWNIGGNQLPRSLDGSQFAELPPEGGVVAARLDQPVTAGQPMSVTFLAWSEKPAEARVIFVRACKDAADDGAVISVNLTTKPQTIRVEHTFQQDFPCTQLQLQTKGTTVHVGPAVLASG